MSRSVSPDAALPGVSALARAWETYRDEFPIFQETTYLNTCSLCALGTRVRRAVDRCLDLWNTTGGSAWYGPWWQELDRLRESFARLIGSDREEVALFPSITAGLSAVASCFDYRARPRVVVADIDFPTVAYQWLAKRGRGVEVAFVRSPDRLTVPLALFERAIDDRTVCVATSHVYFQSGAIQDIAALARLAHARGAYLLVDAYQSAGQLPIDVRAAGADFLVTGGLKWLLGGPGIAYVYARRALHPQLQPEVFGWFGHRDQFAFDVTRLEYADDARRLEGGTPAIAAVYAGRAGLEYVHELSPARLRARQVELTTALVEALRSAGVAPRLAGGVAAHAGIITVPVPDPPAAVAGLASQRIIVDQRPGVVRLSPYFYNTVEDIERAVAGLRRYVR
ncbi:MAG TPA: aminotransferase class V-fold PLP-dependent enzyme [bacterium]|nr:aminotransferase class V-fold PLP-dependent enzyme [bacterium]